MKLNCPYCKKELDFHEMQFEADLRAALELTSALGRHGHLAMAYCYLFGVSPLKLKAKKLRLLLEEIKRLFDAQSFSYQKKIYPISHMGIAEALDICIKKNFATPLDSHNYLKKIMISISERESKDKSRSDEKDLRNREQKQLAGHNRPEAAPSPQSSPSRGEDEGEGETRPSEAEVKSNLERVGNIIKSIGVRQK